MRVRRFFALCMVIIPAVLSMPAAAQNAPRVPPSNDNISSRKAILVPFQETIATAEATVQVGEQPHACIGQTGEKSVWYAIEAPAGATLVVDTTGSNYDTVVSVWAVPTLAFLDQIVSVDCEDDGTAAALLKYPVTSGGTYLVSISGVPVIPAGPPESLVVAFNFQIPASEVPAGGSLADAVPLIINGTTTVKKMELAVNHAMVVGAPTCDAASAEYPVWFKLTLPIAASLSFSSEGSLFGRLAGPTPDVTLDIFPETFAAAGDSLACDDNSGFNSAAYIGPIPLTAGVYYLRATLNTTSNPGLASRVKITTRLTAASDMLVNGTFNDPVLGWTIKNATGDGITSNIFRFVGNPGENSQLQQKVTFSPALPVDDSILAEFTMVSSASPAGQTFSISLKYAYTDGTIVIDKRSLKTFTGSHTVLTTLLKKSLKSIKLAIKFKGTTGTFELDNAALTLEGFVGREASAALPLPLPPAQ